MHKNPLFIAATALSALTMIVGFILAAAPAAAGPDEAKTKPDAQKETIEMRDDESAEPKEEKPESTVDKVKRDDSAGGGETKEEADAAEEDTGIVWKTRKGPRFALRGQAKNLYAFHRTDNYYIGNPFNASHHNLSADLTRLRLSPELKYRNILTLGIDYDNELIGSNYGKSPYFDDYWRPSRYNDFLRTAWEPSRSGTVYYRTKIHRAFLILRSDAVSATIGKQQIRFGAGRLWNPLDLLNPLSPVAIEGAGEQKGTDAVRLDIFPDEAAEITLVYDLKKSNDDIRHFNMQDCNYLIRAKGRFKGLDIAVTGGYVARRGTGGFDFTADLLGGKLRGTAMAGQSPSSYVETELTVTGSVYLASLALLPGRNDSRSIYFQAGASYEYAFDNSLHIMVEYFYNQRAANYVRDLKMAMYAVRFNAMDQKTYLQTANHFLTLNQHYLSASVEYDFNPLLRGELFIIADIQGRGIFWSPALKINAYKNLVFSAGVMGAFTFNNRASDFSEFRKNYLFYCSGAYSF